ncbi:MAG: CsbD family protein [Actinomycetota bacterium]|nr:CsbD family protein [Actinomycetota bacterium]
MGNEDKMKNKGEGALGKGKEKLGSATDDKSLENEGRKDQSKSDMKQAGEKVKDAFKK